LIVQSRKRSGPILIEAADASPFAAPLTPTTLALRVQPVTLRQAVPMPRERS